jgi:hypothetical protein
VRSVTVEQILAWRPCSTYTEARIRELATGRESFTAEDFAALTIPTEDRLWCILHEELIPERDLRMLAADYATAALRCEQEVGREPDQRSWNAVEVARRYARGEIREAALVEARAAAWAAVRVAEWAVARAAARAAAWAAEWAAKWAAARAATWAAARVAETGVAEWAVKWAAERERQLVMALDAAKAAGGEG